MITIEPKLKKIEGAYRKFIKTWKTIYAWLEKKILGILMVVTAICGTVGFFLPNLDISLKLILAAGVLVPVAIFLFCLHHAQYRDRNRSKLYCKSFHDIAHAIRSIRSKEEERALNEICRRFADVINDPSRSKREIDRANRECDKLLAQRINESVKRNLNKVCEIIYETAQESGLKIEAVTIKCKLGDRLIRIGRHGADARRYSNSFPGSRNGCEEWQSVPFYTLLSRSACTYSTIRKDKMRKFEKSYRILAINDIEKWADHHPNDVYDIIHATKDMSPVGKMKSDAVANKIANEICQDMPKRANGNYFACLGVPILPSSEALDDEDYRYGIPGFIGIDSKDGYVWDVLSEDLIAFLAAIADLLHNIIMHDLIVSFRFNTKIVP